MSFTSNVNFRAFYVGLGSYNQFSSYLRGTLTQCTKNGQFSHWTMKISILIFWSMNPFNISCGEGYFCNKNAINKAFGFSSILLYQYFYRIRLLLVYTRRPPLTDIVSDLQYYLSKFELRFKLQLLFNWKWFFQNILHTGLRW